MKRLYSPQEKKRLSYQKDRRNTYGERGSHSRHAIADSKAIVRRNYRHRIDRLLNIGAIDCYDFLEEIEIEVKSIRRGGWKKCPDTPLGEVVEMQMQRRYRMGINATVKKITVFPK